MFSFIKGWVSWAGSAKLTLIFHRPSAVLLISIFIICLRRDISPDKDHVFIVKDFPMITFLSLFLDQSPTFTSNRPGTCQYFCLNHNHFQDLAPAVQE
jgi:hypothetical protein